MSKLPHTPGDWTVRASTEHYGGYYIQEASEEQRQGWQGDDQEQEEVEHKDYGNTVLISAAPVWYTLVLKLRAGEITPAQFAAACLTFADQLEAAYEDILKAE